jgi:hypothetical protein
MSKKLLVIIVCVVLFFTLLFYLLSRNAGNRDNQTEEIIGTNQTININHAVPSPDADKFSIDTQNGTVDVNNVYKNPLDHLSFDGVSFKDNSDYFIAYYPQEQGFLIVLHNPDIGIAREKAEADFLQTLGITKEQACSLNVSLTVPEDVNSLASGGNYGLSFCPKGKPFPEQ